MREEFDEDVEDVQQAILAGRQVRQHGPYGILVGDQHLRFVPCVINDPTPTGAQILGAAQVQQPVEHLLYQVLSSGLLEEIRPDEVVDLRTRGVEKFLVFRSDRSFRLLIDDRSCDWGVGRITGAALKQLAGVKIPTHDVWQVIVGGEDRLIDDREFVDLDAPGVERFATRPVVVRIIVNARQREVHKRRLSYWDVVKLAFPDAVPAPNTVYTITYSRGPHANPEGSLVDGQEVQVKDGMTFYVTVTDKS